MAQLGCVVSEKAEDKLREHPEISDGRLLHGTWKSAFACLARMQAGMYAGTGRDQVAWDQALTDDMVYSQPVVHELSKITVPRTLFIGQRDRTAIGKDLASASLRARLGDYPVLGRRAVAAIPGARLIEFVDLGNSPQVQNPEGFKAALLMVLLER